MKDTAEKRQQVYKLMKANQGRIGATCEEIGISRECYYRWRRIHPTWANEIDGIEKELIDRVKAKGFQLAINEGNVSMIQFILKNKLQKEFNAPEKIAPTDPSGTKAAIFNIRIEANGNEPDVE